MMKISHLYMSSSSISPAENPSWGFFTSSGTHTHTHTHRGRKGTNDGIQLQATMCANEHFDMVCMPVDALANVHLSRKIRHEWKETLTTKTRAV